MGLPATKAQAIQRGLPGRRAGPPRPALSPCGFLPSGSPARPASPRSDSASSASATVSSASLPAGAAVHSGKCPKAVSWAAGRVQGSQCCRTCFSTSNHHCFFFSSLVFHRRATPTALRGRKKVSKAPLDVTSTCSSQASFPALFPFNPH